MANIFELCIKPTQSKAGRPRIELAESGKEWLKNVLDKPDITYVTPCRKDHRYVGKVDGKSQKRYPEVSKPESMSRNDILCGHSMIY